MDRIATNLLLDHFADGIVLFDAAGEVTGWNRVLASWTGLTEADVRGRALTAVFPWRAEGGADFVGTALAGERASTRGELFGAFSEDRGARTFELRSTPLSDGRRIVGGMASLRDVTHEQKLRAVAQELDDRFRVMADQAPVLLWMSELDGRCTFFNQIWLDFTGRTLAQEYGYGWAEGVHFEDFQLCVDTYMTHFSRRRPFSMEYRLRRHDGEFRWVLDRGAPRFDGNGDFAGYIGSCIDITEMKNAQAERERLHVKEREARAAAERLYEEAQRASRLKDEFLATVSHELRTPMNAILGWTSLLTAGDTPEVDYPAVFATIERNARAQARLIEDLLDVSKIITGKLVLDRQPVDLWPILNQVAESLSLSMDAKRLTLTVLGGPGLGIVVGDPTRLTQVVWNLLANAVKFTPAEGSIVLRLTRNYGAAEIVVEDSGEGIPPAFLPEIFERFRQADSSAARRHGGLGLGLAIVRHLTELHGGTVRAESDGLGLGARFVVTLPFVAGQSLAASAKKIGAVAATGRAPPKLAGLQVLAVDDSLDSLTLLAAVLRRQAAGVVTAVSAADAVAQMAEHDFDVILSDISMPGETGFDFLRKVQAIRGRAAPPIIALTAHARREEQEFALRAGFAAYVAKPFDQQMLIETIVKALKARASSAAAAPTRDEEAAQ